MVEFQGVILEQLLLVQKLNVNQAVYSKLYCIALLHCTVLHCALYGISLPYCTVLHCTILHCTAGMHCTILHCATLNCTILHSTDALHQYSKEHCGKYCVMC